MSTALEVRYETRASGGVLVQDITVPADGDTPHTITGLTAGQTWRTRARRRYEEGWSDWGETTVWQTLTVEPPAPVLAIEFLSPAYGEPIRGEEAPITWTDVTVHGRTVAAFHLSGDLGDTWDAVAGATATGVEFDSTELNDGFWIARLTLDDDTEIEHPGFLIDNDDVAAWENRFRPEDEVDFARYWNPGVTRFTLGGAVGCMFGNTGHIGANGPASFGPTSPIDLTFNRGALATASMAAFVSGGGFQWDRTWPGELLDLGLAMISHTGPNIGIRCGVRHTLLSSAMGPFPDPSDPHRFIGVGTGEFFLTVGPVLAGDTSLSGTLHGGWGLGFTVPVPVGISWMQMRAGGAGPTDGCRVRPYHFALTVTQPDAGSFPNRYDILARVNGPDAWSATGRYSAVIQETVDTPEPLECGHISFFTRKTAHSHYSNLSARVLRSFSTVVYDDCEDPPEPEIDEPEEAPEFELPPGRPCALHLECFEDDGVTRFWEVTDDPDWLGYGEALPYLLDPAHQYSGGYGEQELDFVEGRASIGRAEWLIADVHQTAGDQDSGWLTERLSRNGRTAIHGRRMRWRRYVGEFAGGWITIADGPGDAPRMDDSYAGFRGYVRDTRETERKTRAFVRSGTWGLPWGPEDGYGRWEDGAGTHYLIPPTEPLTGTYNGGGVNLNHYWSAVNEPPDPVWWQVDPAVVIREGIEELMFAREEVTEDGILWTWPQWEILWRPAGTTEDWRVIVPSWLADPNINYAWYLKQLVWIGDARLDFDTLVRAANAIPFRTTDPEADLPTINDEIDVAVRYIGEPTEAIPQFIEGLTDGELLKALYDGEYSPRDMDGAVQPTGIRYDPVAVLKLDVPVRLRITEPTKDLRDWTERHIYRIRGYTPALDHDGRISPMSDRPPESDEYDGDWVDDAVDINNAITEPRPDWNAGSRIVNEVRTSYPRDYVDLEGNFRTREVKNIWKPAVSLHGEQIVEINALAYRAVGTPEGGPIEAETGATLAAERGTVLISRYGEGAQGFQVPVMREHTWMLRAGSWVICDLSWFPDYQTQRRRMITMGQVVAIKDLDCAWREIVFEEVLPVEIPEVPPPVGSGEIAVALLTPPAHQTSEVTLHIAGASSNASRTWQVLATVIVTEQGESPVTVMQDSDITSALDPVTGTVSTTQTEHEWDAGYLQGGPIELEGDNKVDVWMVVRIIEDSEVLDEVTVFTSYTTEDEVP